MANQRPEAVLRAVAALGGLVATAAGLHTALTGARSIPGRVGETDAALESEIRFFGAFYAGHGVRLLEAAAGRRAVSDELPRTAAVLLAAGMARAGGWIRAGRPTAPQQALLAVELAAPPAVVALLARARPR